MSEPTTHQGPRLNRRQSIQLGAIGFAAASAPALNREASAASPDPAVGPTTRPWMEPLPVYQPKQNVASLDPAPAQYPWDGECGRSAHQFWPAGGPGKLYNIHAQVAQHAFHPQLPMNTVWAYDGMLPGPTIVARYNEPALVRFHADIDPYAVGYGSPEITVHLHNLHAASESDGFAGDYFSTARYGPSLTRAGAFKDHLYLNRYAGFSTDPAGIGDPREALGTLWYHDHRMDFTEQNVYRGMFGTYLLFDDVDSGDEHDTNPQALRLPSGVGRYDIPLLFADFLFDQSGYVLYNALEIKKGHLGNKLTVNGKIQPFFKVERRKYRFRLINASVARFYQFYLKLGTANQSFTRIATDGNLLPAPLTMNNTRVPPAARADIVIDFSQYPIGSKLFLVNRLAMADGRGPSGLTANDRVLRFDVDSDPTEPDVSQVPAKLRALPPIELHKVVNRRRFEFKKEINDIWVVNDKIFDVEKAAVNVKRGTAEIWELIGHGDWHHPIHIHLEEGRILKRNGKAPPAHERGRMDVYTLAPEERVEVFIRFRDFTGKYLMHCHNLSHEDHAMMLRFDVRP